MERKRKAKISASKPKKKKFSPPESDSKIIAENTTETKEIGAIKPSEDNKLSDDDKYPLLKDEELVKKFMSVPITNNQKGRIRQTVKAYVTGSSEDIVPQVLHDKMQEILNQPEPLNETSLRKMRIIYNMLKTTLENKKDSPDKDKKKNKNKKSKKDKDKNKSSDENSEKIKDENIQDSSQSNSAVEASNDKVKNEVSKDDKKVKGPRRYVVFVGNLPVDITEDTIRKHFSSVSQHIQDIRVPPRPENNKSCIAYVELKNETAYELALSKHHSMLSNKRINVLYTAQKNGKISKTEAKSKAAKLVALQKAGKLLGSVPLNKKRSHRRAIMKAARAKENASN